MSWDFSSRTLFSRRFFIKTLAASSLVARGLLLERAALAAQDESTGLSPLAIVRSPPLSSFGGDDPRRPHSILWDKARYLAERGGIPLPTERVSVVILGGGIAGLSAAYQLRDLSPILLEQAGQLGGNAKGERWGDLEYGTGSAYLSLPEEGGSLSRFLKELGILRNLRVHSGDEPDPVLLRSQVSKDFWHGSTDPARGSEFREAKRKFNQIFQTAYPDIPPTPESKLGLEQTKELDRISFSVWVRRNFRNLHPHLEEFFIDYCWDAMAGGIDELSAAQVLNFLTADLQGMAAFPGGNAAISKALFSQLSKGRNGNLRGSALVVDVSPRPEGVWVCYVGANGKLKTIQARACVVTLPKFVARRVISSLPDDQSEAMGKLNYRAYLVANILLNRRVSSIAYEMFKLKETIPVDLERESRIRAFTTLIFGSWANYDRSNRSVLTLYQALPYAGSRRELLGANAFSEAKTRFENQIPDLLNVLRIPLSSIAGMRIARWGHALPVAAVGLFADQVLATASRQVGNRIFFAQQDNWANPCVDTAVKTALDAASAVKEVLR